MLPVCAGRIGEPSRETLDEAARLGVTMLDTAERYAGGASERIIGGWLAERDPAVTASTRITTKVAPAWLAGGTARFDTAFITAKVSCGALALAWVTHHSAVTAAIVGPSRTSPHLGLAAEALQVQLAEDDCDRIEASFRAAVDG
jgi:aryl-alcohol dehydrogenase-like predicted oxidoreductase